MCLGLVRANQSEVAADGFVDQLLLPDQQMSHVRRVSMLSRNDNTIVNINHYAVYPHTLYGLCFL